MCYPVLYVPVGRYGTGDYRTVLFGTVCLVAAVFEVPVPTLIKFLNFDIFFISKISFFLEKIEP